MKEKSTVALNMLVKDEGDAIWNLLGTARTYFDQINLTVSDKPTANKLKKACDSSSFRHVNVKWREWNGHFDDARNENFAMSTCDYNFWLDADDTFDFRAIPKLVEIADEGKYGAIFLPYNYAQDEQGNCIARHWRERLTRRDLPFVWKGWVHESQICDTPYSSHRVNVEVKHNTSPDHAGDSLVRNHEILVEAAEATGDPRYLHYLGMSYFSLKAWPKAIETLEAYLEVGGSVEDVYRSLCMVSEAHFHNKNSDTAMQYIARAALLLPKYPMAYWYMAQYELAENNYEEALEWVRVSETKPDPQTLSVWDPTSRERAVLIAAQCEYYLGNFNKALAELRKIEGSALAQGVLPEFIAEADKETFFKALPKMAQYFESDKALWSSLSREMKYDSRLRTLRQSVTEPKTWSDKSIVFFCGQGYEDWGPHTLDKGMGGSEEAVIYLSRALAKLGYEVTVFAEADLQDGPLGIYERPNDVSLNHKLYGGEWEAVQYRPWQEFDLRDDFNVIVGWRSPKVLEQVTAKVKLADIHDVVPKEMIKEYPDITYMVKSQYHRDLYPDVPDNKFVVIGNGIEKGHFL